jgi:hypothetical protein
MIGLLAIGQLMLNAQTAIPVSGGNASGTGGSISYSVGQVVYTTATRSNGSIIQGVQQPFEISVVTGIEDKLIVLICSVYPNPITDFLTLKIDNYEVEDLSYWLYDFRGNLLKKNKVDGNETQIAFQNLASGTYFLKVTSDNNVLKTFKIIKN